MGRKSKLKQQKRNLSTGENYAVCNPDKAIVSDQPFQATLTLHCDDMETLHNLQKEFAEDFQKGRPSKRLEQLLKDSIDYGPPPEKTGGITTYTSHTPHVFMFNDSPEEHEAASCAVRFSDVVRNFELKPLSDTQKYYFRILENCQFMRGLAIFHRLFGIIPDPLKDCPLPKQVISNLLLNVNVDVAIFGLMTAGEQKVKEFAEVEGVDMPSERMLEMFLEGCIETIKKHLTEIITPPAQEPSRSERDEERKFKKFLNHSLDPDEDRELIEKYRKELKQGGWFEFVLLALHPYRYTDLEPQWGNYMEARKRQLAVRSKTHWDSEGNLYARTSRNSKKPIGFSWKDGSLIGGLI
ncbi:hypothetical protein [Stenomitos frigidus]|uniref:Uncharacterized protein n=1 Tax=Stenomitos frigidus ULC18 TaxID=2107698 RepID=A0A2T1EBT5_9CYAN|nr:hypothetical protein [Stenomitos frigidus]PSB30168.1 hypothetical protein C7B82_09440 [Stenomitos frigidus ULC18]